MSGMIPEGEEVKIISPFKMNITSDDCKLNIQGSELLPDERVKYPVLYIKLIIPT